jgi:DNA-directed RNA polymerase subunit M/transcription elongation factor TFIIS
MKLCPNCGHFSIYYENYSEDSKIVCLNCGNEFWASEALDSEDEGKWSLKELKTWGGRA